MNEKNIGLIIFFTFRFLTQLNGQFFLNGSFEDNSSANCGINLTNDFFNNLVDHTFAFGEKDEVDILTEECGYGPASDGDFFLALSSNVFTDQISLELDKIIQKGKLFSFKFDQKYGILNTTNSGVSIGISSLPDTFGKLVYTSMPISDKWQTHHVEFESPIDAKYITVKTNNLINTWVFIDNFQAACPENFNIGNDTIVCNVSDIVLSSAPIYDSYLWDDNSTSHTKQVTEAGLQWVEVKLNNCVVRDSIFINEYPSQCKCEIFTPNIFAPNSVGLNNEFKIQSNCPFTDFEIIIFDRWGNSVFQNLNPFISWNGKSKNKDMESGVYLYSIKYQFEYESFPNYTHGDVMLIR
ncbi:MAG: gliding motility-associated C-terminal domain-containing protein [Saprospiraceae bacterium]|nr:gliding motility-associated C-terminal domain-containing protein [Saprospiraceae bacterium]